MNILFSAMRRNRVATQLLSLLFIVCFLFSATPTAAQEGVRNGVSPKAISGKVMLVPYEPKMFMGDIGEKIYVQTKWNYTQLSEYFRKQLDIQMKLKLQSVLSPVVSFYTDSAKTSKDLGYIYKSTTIGFDLVDKPYSPTATNIKKEQGIKNGQIVVEVSNDKKFSNIRINDKELLPYLYKKYSTGYFVFINELDMKTLTDSYDLTSDTYQREVTVHYTIVDNTGKLITAGASVTKFSSKINDPKKIVALTFPPLASYIAVKLSAFLKSEGK